MVLHLCRVVGSCAVGVPGMRCCSVVFRQHCYAVCNDPMRYGLCNKILDWLANLCARVVTGFVTSYVRAAARTLKILF